MLDLLFNLAIPQFIHLKMYENSTCYGPTVCVPHVNFNSHVEILTPKGDKVMMVLVGGVFVRRFVSYEGGALINKICSRIIAD